MTPISHDSSAAGGRSYLDRVLEALNHRRRRHLLYHLRENGTADVEEAAKEVIALERGVDADEVSDSEADPVHISLYHSHVPKLDGLGVIDYDRRSGTIRLRNPPEELEEFLDLTRSIEERDPR